MEHKLRGAVLDNPMMSRSVDSCREGSVKFKAQLTPAGSASTLKLLKRKKTSTVRTEYIEQSVASVLQNLTKFVPSLVIKKLISRAMNSDNARTELPELEHMETVVIFADISGFTNLSERCATKGRAGNEELAFCINSYMDAMVSNLN